MQFSSSVRPSMSSSPDQTRVPVAIRRVVLRGAPFKNPATVKELVMHSVPRLTSEDADRVITQASEHPTVDTTVIVCLENEANEYCRNLVENGLESEVA